jgi:hypothetical protein
MSLHSDALSSSKPSNPSFRPDSMELLPPGPRSILQKSENITNYFNIYVYIIYKNLQIK